MKMYYNLSLMSIISVTDLHNTVCLHMYLRAAPSMYHHCYLLTGNLHYPPDSVFYVVVLSANIQYVYFLGNKMFIGKLHLFGIQTWKNKSPSV